MSSSPHLVLPVVTEFLDGLKFLCGDGLFADIKRQLLPAALEVIRSSLLSPAHPCEVLQSLGDMHWRDLVENPHTSSTLNRLLDDVETHARLQGMIGMLYQPVVMHRMRVEWLHEMTVGRFDDAIPFLHREEELLKGWEEFCGGLRESSINPFEAAEKEAQRRFSSPEGDVSDFARRLHRLSFLAACRKLFVYFSGAKETWAGSYACHSFKLSRALADRMSHDTRDNRHRGERLSLRFGRADHVFYLKPTLEQLQSYLDCIKSPELTTAVQRKLCPFICARRKEFNYLADLFYRVYAPGRLREIHQPPEDKTEEAFLRESGMKREFFRRFHFLPLDMQVVALLSAKMEELPRLRAFLRHPRTECGLVRQRVFRGMVEPMLKEVVQKALFSLCRQWNPLLRTEEGATLPLMDCVETKVSREVGDHPDAAPLRERLVFDELLKVLSRNTRSWQEAFANDGFLVDRDRAYFMTILDKAIEESGSEETRRARYRNCRCVACVVVE